VFAEDGPLEAAPIAARVNRSTVAVQSLLSELQTDGILERTGERTYALSEDVRAELTHSSTGE